MVMTTTTQHTATSIYAILETVADPEVPVLSILDLGIVRDVQLRDGVFHIVITPTYSGCPATEMIQMQIRMALLENGITNFQIEHRLSPAWTTDWMSEAGKQKLQAYGIAPPEKKFSIPEDGVTCPQCHSTNTQLVSAFGSTACKALYQCRDCKEPFDYFKCH
jgi:ring-1,2-phenylacetyl-CoA epoxidase subunit PaaD